MIKYEHRRHRFLPTPENGPAPRPCTIMVLGLTRGGCSMVSTVLDAMGVYMGPQREVWSGGTFENHVMRSPNAEYRMREIARCNERHDLWGFKTTPGYTAEQWHAKIRNPIGVYVFRDPLSTAERRLHSEERYMKLTLYQCVQHTLIELGTMLDLYEKAEYPKIACSYDRWVREAAAYSTAVAKQLGIDLSATQLSECIDRISPIGGYIDNPYRPKQIGDPAAVRQEEDGVRCKVRT